ncbi:MAG: hypothetical protein AB2404_11390 [Planifilum fimeticola]
MIEAENRIADLYGNVVKQFPSDAKGGVPLGFAYMEKALSGTPPFSLYHVTELLARSLSAGQNDRF